MDLHYWKSPEGNFGDDLNEFLWDALLPGWRDWDAGTTLVGVGTILNATHFPVTRPGRFLVLGSGVGNGPPPDISDPARWDIRSLRGPRSARALNLPESVGVIDPAIMLSDLPEFTGHTRDARPIFIPHISSLGHFDWDAICARAGIDFVSPCGEASAVITRIAKAPLVLAESMHAAIIADTLRTPWIGVRVSAKFDAAKWQDWADSLGIALQVHPLFPLIAKLSDRFSKARKRPHGAAPAAAARSGGQPGPQGQPHAKPVMSRKRQLRLATENRLAAPALRRIMRAPSQLSDAARLEQSKARYRDILDGVRRDYSGG
ncbi:MAG: polysaccharide pyruvyl transferase family protein [Pseudooceanicola sp.]